jgi:hypothetical protein
MPVSEANRIIFFTIADVSWLGKSMRFVPHRILRKFHLTLLSAIKA